jgi:hypothetical protein
VAATPAAAGRLGAAATTPWPTASIRAGVGSSRAGVGSGRAGTGSSSAGVGGSRTGAGSSSAGGGRPRAGQGSSRAAVAHSALLPACVPAVLAAGLSAARPTSCSDWGLQAGHAAPEAGTPHEWGKQAGRLCGHHHDHAVAHGPDPPQQHTGMGRLAPAPQAGRHGPAAGHRHPSSAGSRTGGSGSGTHHSGGGRFSAHRASVLGAHHPAGRECGGDTAPPATAARSQRGGHHPPRSSRTAGRNSGRVSWGQFSDGQRTADLPSCRHSGAVGEAATRRPAAHQPASCL